MSFMRFLAAGWPRAWLIPIERDGKRPVSRNWTQGVDGDPKQWDEIGFNVGVRCGIPDGRGWCVYGLDVDSEDINVVNAAREAFTEYGGQDYWIIGERVRAEKSNKALLAIRAHEGLSLPRTTLEGRGHAEFLGNGKQFVAWGRSPVGKGGPVVAYEWVGVDGDVPVWR